MKGAMDTGMNRTGVGMSPKEARRTVEGAQEGTSLVPLDGSWSAAFRAEYLKEASPIGTLPPPASAKGLLKTAVTAIKGEKANVFIDKLGERLAFERTGVRLYDLVLGKIAVYPSWKAGPTRADLLEIQHEELAHVGLMKACLEKLGADPTSVTPSAALAANLSKGVPLVLADPRTDLRQCLEGLLVAELADNASWELLIALGREMGQDEMVEAFVGSLTREQDHLRRVRGWLEEGMRAELTAEAPRKPGPEEAPGPQP